MVLGTTSGAGKSWLTTALCRWYARLGYTVAPFKAQNMSNNARVVESGEIGSAQYFQALAAKTIPTVQMNPILLKPEADTKSQVVLLGKVNRLLSHMPWRKRSRKLWPIVRESLESLLNTYQIVIIEGAGSPAEINLQSSDIVNIRIARYAKADCLLVTDIDRGGAFAHLYGTWALLSQEDRQQIRGFVLNKFRGDASLLSPGPQKLQKLTGIPTVATLPMWWEHGLPEEDGIIDEYPKIDSTVPTQTIAIVCYPRISNLDEFQPLKNVKHIQLCWARTPRDIDDVDWIILPGSKQTMNDLKWLRAQGLDRAILAHATAGKRVLGICGGMQMLGETLKDPYEKVANTIGLGLLPLTTTFKSRKIVRHREMRFTDVAKPWSALSNTLFRGYEIHTGHTFLRKTSKNPARMVLPNIAWQNEKGNVLGLYLHGLFENPAILQSLLGATTPHLETVFDQLTDFIDQHFQSGFLKSLVNKGINV